MNEYLGSLNLTETLLAKDSLLAGTNFINSYDFASNTDRSTVTRTQLSANAVGTSTIADGAITTAKLAGSVVTNVKIASSAVDGRIIASGAVGSTEIASSEVHGSHISDFNFANGTGTFNHSQGTGIGTFTDLRANTSLSANGTVGISTIATIVSVVGAGTTTHTLTFRYGLLTAYGTA